MDSQDQHDGLVRIWQTVKTASDLLVGIAKAMPHAGISLSSLSTHSIMSLGDACGTVSGLQRSIGRDIDDLEGRSPGKPPPDPPEVPPGYWSGDIRYHYCHHDVGNWSVRDSKSDETVVQGLEKTVAAAVAAMMNGDVLVAQAYLSTVVRMKEASHG